MLVSSRYRFRRSTARWSLMPIVLSLLSCSHDWTIADAVADAGADAGPGERPNQTTCARGGTCSLTCPSGGCTFNCADNANCNMDCAVGGCQANCENGASCTMNCAGG